MTTTATTRAPRKSVAPRTPRPAPSPVPPVARSRRAPRPIDMIASIDGAPVEGLGLIDVFAYANPSEFADTIVASLVALATGATRPVVMTSCGKLVSGLYAASYQVGSGKGVRRVRVVFGPRSMVTADALLPPAPASAEATPAPVAAPAPAPVAAPAVAKAASYSVTLPIKPAAPAGAKAASAAAHPAKPVIVSFPQFATASLTIIALGALKGSASDIPNLPALRARDAAEAAAWVRGTLLEPARQFLGWQRITIQTAPTRLDRTSWHVVLTGSSGQKASAVIRPQVDAPLAATPAAIASPATARVDALAARAGLTMPQTTAAARHRDVAARAAAAPARAPAEARMSGRTREAFEAAQAGTIPTAPDFTADTHARYRARLAEAVAAVKRKDITALTAQSAGIQPISSSRTALKRYIDFALIALKAKGAK